MPGLGTCFLFKLRHEAVKAHRHIANLGYGLNPGLLIETCDHMSRIGIRWLITGNSLESNFFESNSKCVRCIKYYQSQTQALVPLFCKQLNSLHSERDSPPPYVDAQDSDDDHKTSDFFSMQSTQVIDIHLPTIHCVWATCAFLQKQKYHTAYGFQNFLLSLKRLVETIAPVFSSVPWPRAKSLPVLTTTVSVLLLAFTACQQSSRWHSQRVCSLHATISWCLLKTIQFNF